MKEVALVDKIYIAEFDIYVNPYLTYAQIQQITNAVLKQKTWAARQQNIDMLLLYHATNLDKSIIESHSHDYFLQSGIIDTVKKQIINLNQLMESLDYSESFQQILIRLVEKLGTQNFLGKENGKKTL